MRLRSLSVLAMLAVLGALLLAVSASGASADTERKTYIVQMLKDPVASYDGGVAGIPATQPARGEKVDVSSSAAQRYIEHLRGDHATALEQVGGATKLYDYSVSYNGFAAELTEAQASKLEKAPGVIAVTEDELLHPDTSSTPDFIGLDQPDRAVDEGWAARRRPARTSSSASSTRASGPSTRASRTRTQPVRVPAARLQPGSLSLERHLPDRRGVQRPDTATTS